MLRRLCWVTGGSPTAPRQEAEAAVVAASLRVLLEFAPSALYSMQGIVNSRARKPAADRRRVISIAGASMISVLAACQGGANQAAQIARCLDAPRELTAPLPPAAPNIADRRGTTAAVWHLVNDDAPLVTTVAQELAAARSAPTRVSAQRNAGGMALLSAPLYQQVVPPEPPSNEPTGLSVFTDRTFYTLYEQGWSAPSPACATLIYDPSAPTRPNVMLVTYPAGLEGGSTPMAQLCAIPDSATEVYGRITIKFSSNFVGHPSGVNKLLYVWSDDSGADGDRQTPTVYLSAQAVGGDNFQPQIRTQGAEFNDLTPNLADQIGYAFTRDAWVTWEFYLKMNSPGASDGIARWWLNGVQVAEYTNQRYAAVATQAHWIKLQIAPYWGGVGGSLSATQYLYWNQMRASAR